MGRWLLFLRAGCEADAEGDVVIGVIADAGDIAAFIVGNKILAGLAAEAAAAAVLVFIAIDRCAVLKADLRKGGMGGIDPGLL